LRYESPGYGPIAATDRTSRQHPEPNAPLIATVPALRHQVAERNATNRALERQVGETRQSLSVAREHCGYWTGLPRADGIDPPTGERK
jgi:hypothetical protein